MVKPNTPAPQNIPATAKVQVDSGLPANAVDVSPKPVEAGKAATVEDPKRLTVVSAEDLIGEDADNTGTASASDVQQPRQPPKRERGALRDEKGHWIPRRVSASGKPIGRPPDSTPGKRQGGAATPDFTDLTQAPIEPAPDYDMMAGMVFDSGTNTLALIFGPEWQAQNPEERGAVIGALKKYFEAKQVKDIPPGLLLCVVLVAYSAPRLRAPKTSEKIRFGWTWLKLKWAALRGKKKPGPLKLVNTEKDGNHDERTSGNVSAADGS